jgi:hypothetical protein
LAVKAFSTLDWRGRCKTLRKCIRIAFMCLFEEALPKSCGKSVSKGDPAGASSRGASDRPRFAELLELNQQGDLKKLFI